MNARDVIKKLREEREYVCSGMQAGCKFPEHMKLDGLANIKKARAYIDGQLNDYDDNSWRSVCETRFSRGKRYYDDDMILWRMASAMDKYQQPINLFKLALAALIDSADADYYYSFEKDWK